jgi:hypothetical protein
MCEQRRAPQCRHGSTAAETHVSVACQMLIRISERSVHSSSMVQSYSGPAASCFCRNSTTNRRRESALLRLYPYYHECSVLSLHSNRRADVDTREPHLLAHPFARLAHERFALIMVQPNRSFRRSALRHLQPHNMFSRFLRSKRHQARYIADQESPDAPVTFASSMSMLGVIIFPPQTTTTILPV